MIDIRRNLVSGSLLNKHGFYLVFDSNKFALTKNGLYVGKGYECGGMFKLNVTIVKPKMSKNNNIFSIYLIRSSNLFGMVDSNMLVIIPCEAYITSIIYLQFKLISNIHVKHVLRLN